MYISWLMKMMMMVVITIMSGFDTHATTLIKSCNLSFNYYYFHYYCYCCCSYYNNQRHYYYSYSTAAATTTTTATATTTVALLQAVYGPPATERSLGTICEEMGFYLVLPSVHLLLLLLPLLLLPYLFLLLHLKILLRYSREPHYLV